MGCGASTKPRAAVVPIRPEDQDFSVLTHGTAPARIPEVAFRGILPSQLQKLVGFVRSRCRAGSDVVEGWHDTFSGAKELRWRDINLYHLCSWVIGPLTAASHFRCSYVEAVAEDPQEQRPAWFVSHWWGEPVADFVACVTRHQYLRGLQGKSAYWVCAYANCQHDLGTELGTDPMQSSFLKAMRFSVGVLLILDVQTPANAFSRVWCCFEEGIVTLASRGLLDIDTGSGREHLHALAARTGIDSAEAPLLFDVSAVDKNGFPHLITQGLTVAEEEAENGPQSSALQSSGWQRKILRERDFPLDIVRSGLSADITKSSSTVEVDKTRILNALAGRSQEDLDSTPDTEHLVYGIVNQILHSTFAVATWHQAVARRCDISDMGELPLERALRDDTTRQKLELNLSHVASQHDVATLARILPLLDNLTTLSLVFKGSQKVSSLDELCASISSLTSLERLRLDTRGCSGLGKLPTWISLLSTLTNLRVLKLDAGCSNFTDISAIAAGVKALTNLTCLYLDFSCCHRLDSLAGIGAALAPLASLQELHLSLGEVGGKGQRSHDGIVELAQGLAFLTCLHTMSLNLKMSHAPTSSLMRLKEGLAGLKALRSLELCLFSCKDLEDLELLRGLGEMRKLQSLKLDADGCTTLSSISGFADALRQLQQLEMLDLHFARLYQLKDESNAAALGQGLAALRSLRALHLTLSSTGCLACSDRLWEGLAPLMSLEALRLDCSNCEGVVDLSRFLPCLPGLSTLKQFTLNLSASRSLQNWTGARQMLECMPLLVDLNLNSSRCTSLAGVGDLSDGLARLKYLQRLDLQLGSIKGLTSLTDFGKQMQNLSAMESLRLNLGSCRNLADIAELGAAVRSLTKLKELDINLNRSTVSSLDTLGSGLRDLATLSSLRLTHGHGTELVGVGSLFPCQLALRELCIELFGCLGITTTADLSQGLAQLSVLEKLKLQYWNCTALASVAGLGKGLFSLCTLRDLHLVLRRCGSVTDWQELWLGLANLASLQALRLNLETNECLSSISGLADALVQLSTVQALDVNLARCGLDNDDLTQMSRAVLALSSTLQSFRINLASNLGLPPSLAQEHTSPSSFVSMAGTD